MACFVKQVGEMKGEKRKEGGGKKKKKKKKQEEKNNNMKKGIDSKIHASLAFSERTRHPLPLQTCGRQTLFPARFEKTNRPGGSFTPTMQSGAIFRTGLIPGLILARSFAATADAASARLVGSWSFIFYFFIKP